MLVMASHSKGGVDEFLLGSVANFVTHNSNELPVVVLHP
jgi:nucleotide-binding universal stress UspA family protein